jgi:hypothetical protein
MVCVVVDLFAYRKRRRAGVTCGRERVRMRMIMI